MNAKIDFDQLEWLAAAPGARFKVAERDGTRVRLLEFTDQFVETDWCRKGHTAVVLEGTLELDFDGRRERFAPGHAFHIAPGEASRHKAAALSERVLLFVVEPI